MKRFKLSSGLLGLGIALLMQPATAVNISQTPLFVSTGATANVVLMIDNSGSMRNLITDAGFDPSVDYPDWSRFCGSSGTSACWTVSSGNLRLSSLPHCSGTSTSDDFIHGRRGGVTRCIRLPDPYGSNNTRLSGNYLNYLLETYGKDGGTVDLRTTIPNKYRLQVARDVAKNIVNSNQNLRIGIAAFNKPVSGNSGPGGHIVAPCGASTKDLLDEIDGLTPSTNTPLAETFYEVTRYFRGMTSYYNDKPEGDAEDNDKDGYYLSPITLRCQKSFVIALTDGFPTYDTSFPTNDPDSTDLPNYDGLDPVTLRSDAPLFPQYSDGFGNHDGGTQGNEGYALYLDDLAKFAFETDMRPSGTDSSGGDFNAPNFAKQNVVTYTVGFALDTQMLIDAAEYGDGLYFTASDEEELQIALQAAFRDIQNRLTSAASVSSNSGFISDDTTIYQARFNPSDWSGGLVAREVKEDGDVSNIRWEAADKIPAPASRKIFTISPSLTPRGRNFNWDTLTPAQQAALNKNGDGIIDGKGPQRLAYLRGARDNEAPLGANFRSRRSLLGDIVNSDPIFVRTPNFGFDELPGTEGSDYASFRASDTYTGRPGMIYVGANDGMLHGIDADTGIERFAFVPNAVFSKLSRLSDADYTGKHTFYVDGTVRVVDAPIKGNWESVLVGSLGAGGRSVFALRVTDPANFSASDVLWEFGSDQDPDMGYSMPQPSIARMNDGKWVAIVANGYNSANGKAVLFILDLATGAVISKISTVLPAVLGNDNGLSTPVPVDVDADQITDFIYAGDLHGNLWKFDVTGSVASWGVAFLDGLIPKPLFNACLGGDPAPSCALGERQSITARPAVGVNPNGGVIVYFGTGRYFAVGDGITTTPINSFYALYDTNEKGDVLVEAIGSKRSKLVEQEVLGTELVHGTLTRITSSYEVKDDDKGWYIDLPESGERQISQPILRGSRVVFTTMTPDADACSFGGSSWLMEMEATTGQAPDYAAFDLNGDKIFDYKDYSEDGPVSGKRSAEGMIRTPQVIVADDLEFKFASGTTGNIDVTVENTTGATGRESWRQLQ